MASLGENARQACAPARRKGIDKLIEKDYPG
jgi:hypothetical protein